MLPQMNAGLFLPNAFVFLLNQVLGYTLGWSLKKIFNQ